MIAFPSIFYDIRTDVDIYAFDKLDGTNIQACWEWNEGFTHFGTRKRPISERSKQFGEAIPLIQKGYEEKLKEIFEYNGVAKATCFFEYFGERSFAGRHVGNEVHQTVLFDVYVTNPPIGFIAPDMFIRYFQGKVPTAPLLYKGIADEAFLEQVREGTLKNMSYEGVVCKGVKRSEGKKERIVFKVKNKHWIQTLKDECKGDVELFNKLV